MGSNKYVKQAKVSDTEKRYKPYKHYVYIIDVAWSDGTNFHIYRKYSELYDLHVTLLEQFPAAAGLGGDRILPCLPTKKMFGRNEIKKVAVERKMYLDEYCRTLLALEAKISQDDTILEFFEPTHSDINPPKDATKRKDSLSLISSLTLMMPKFLQKDKKGKIKDRTSDSVAIPEDIDISGPMNFDTYYVIADYTACAKGEVTLEEGTEVDVIEKNENGWWLVSSGTDQGWAPASFLEPLNINQEIDEPEPLYNGETYVTLAEYKAELDDEVSFPKGVVVEVLHKLLDGWWIISYNDNVGHAPATFLTECHNPHVLAANIPKTKKKPKRPTQRRCTIKNAHSKWGKKQSLPQKDMTLYRKLSDRVSMRKKQERLQGKSLPPPPPTGGKKQMALPLLPQVIQEDENGNNEGDLYVNDSTDDYLAQKRLTAQDDTYEDVDGELTSLCNNQNGNGVVEDVEEEEYVNIDSPVSPLSNNNRALPPVPKPRLQTPPKHNSLPRIISDDKEPQQAMKNNKLSNTLPANTIPTPIALVNNPKLSPKPLIKAKPKDKLDTNGVIGNRKDRSPSPRLPHPLPSNDVKQGDIMNNETSRNGQNGTNKGLLAERIAQFNKT